MLQDLLTAQKQASIFATGLLLLLSLGTLASIALIIVALWAVVELLTLAIQSIVECLTTASNLFTSSPDLVKVLLLAIVGVVAYWLIRRYRRAKV